MGERRPHPHDASQGTERVLVYLPFWMEVRSPISENTHVTLEWVHIHTPAMVEHMMCRRYTTHTVTYDVGALL